MRYKLFKYIMVVPLLLAVGCRGQKTIPKDTLSDIFRDMYLVNAYSGSSTVRPGDYISPDSLNYYEPILNSYGYTSKDFANTLANFTKRKSEKIGPILEDAYNKLDVMLAVLNERIDKENTIDSITQALSRRVVYRDSIIIARAVEDTARLRISLPAEKGHYLISYNFTQDSTDLNRTSNRHTIRDAKNHIVATTSANIRRGEKRTGYSTTLDAKADDVKKLEILFGSYPAGLSTPHFTVDSLVIVWYPESKDARRTYMERFVLPQVVPENLRTDYDRYFENNTKDLGPLPLLPEEFSPQRDTLLVE